MEHSINTLKESVSLRQMIIQSCIHQKQTLDALQGSILPANGECLPRIHLNQDHLKTEISSVNYSEPQWGVSRVICLGRLLTCCEASPLIMWGIMGTSPLSSGGSSSIWSVIIMVTYIHGAFPCTAAVERVKEQKKNRIKAMQLYLCMNVCLHSIHMCIYIYIVN